MLLLLAFSSPNPCLSLLFVAFAELDVLDLLRTAHHQEPGRGSNASFPGRFTASHNASGGETQSLVGSLPDQPNPQLTQVALAKSSLAAERDRKYDKQQSSRDNTD